MLALAFIHDRVKTQKKFHCAGGWIMPKAGHYNATLLGQPMHSRNPKPSRKCQPLIGAEAQRVLSSASPIFTWTYMVITGILWWDLLNPQPLFVCLPHLSVLLIISVTSFLPHMRHTFPEHQVSYPLTIVFSSTCHSASMSMDQLTVNLNDKSSICDTTHLMAFNKVSVCFSLWWKSGTLLCTALWLCDFMYFPQIISFF